jgi:alkylated DNA repair dioxygenase AlkB
LLHLDSATAAGGQLPEPKPRSEREGVANARQELDLFGDDTLPQGFQYRPEFIDPDQEKALLADIRVLPFRDFEFHGFVGKRRVISFGWRYDFNGGGLTRTEDMPGFLSGIREQAAAFAGIGANDLQQILITEYGPGAAIGWHKDRSVFGDVVGISLLSDRTFRLRRKIGARWQRCNLNVEPRSIYLLRGPLRSEWEHSIPAVDSLRYSITFRNVLDRGS